MRIPLLAAAYAAYAIITVYCSLKAILRENLLPEVCFARLPSFGDLGEIIASAPAEERKKAESTLSNYHEILLSRTLWEQEKALFKKQHYCSVGAILMFLSFYIIGQKISALPKDSRIIIAAAYVIPTVTLLCSYKRIVPSLSQSVARCECLGYKSSFTLCETDEYLRTEAYRIVGPLQCLTKESHRIRETANVCTLIAAVLIAFALVL